MVRKHSDRNNIVPYTIAGLLYGRENWNVIIPMAKNQTTPKLEKKKKNVGMQIAI